MSLLPLHIEGVGSDGTATSIVVHVPQPFTFLLMKLHAFADRVDDADADLGRHHALDVYRVIAMLTEQEFETVRQAVQKHGGSRPVGRVREIISTYFSTPTTLGTLRLREHSLFEEKMDVAKFISALADLFR